VNIPWIIWVQFWLLILPGAAALVVWRRRRVPDPVLWLVGWSAIVVWSDTVARFLTMTVGRNTAVMFVAQPAEVAATLMVMSHWQVHDRWSRRIRWTALSMLVVAAVLALLHDDTGFGQWVSPALGLLALAATLWTMVVRTLSSTEHIVGRSWFWICGGLAVYWVIFAAVVPFVMELVTVDLQQAITAIIIMNWVKIGAYVMLGGGVLLDWRQARAAPAAGQPILG